MATRQERLARFGLTVEDYDRLLDEQDGRCAVCFAPPKPNRALAVDHDHQTQQVRGLLCTRCNVALGLLDDDLDRIALLMEYVLRAR